MRYYLFLLWAICLSLLDFSFVSAIDGRCFREYSEMPVSTSQAYFSATPGDEVFFVQNQSLIPSRVKSAVSLSSFGYILHTTLAKDSPQNQAALMDDLRETNMTVTPLDAPSGFRLVLSFDQKLEAGLFTPAIDIETSRAVVFEVLSPQGEYIQVRENDLSTYSFSSLRISFTKEIGPQTNVEIKTLRFDRKPQDIHIVQLMNQSSLIAYRGWTCGANELYALSSKRLAINKGIDTAIAASSPSVIKFSPLPTTGRDSDSDGIIDMRDNCSQIANPDQSDRNFDGIGDLCSDDDGDSIFGDRDNCPTIPNSPQKDQNANNIGDACEFDSDQDGSLDGVDNCIRTPNPDQADSDRDSIGNACDKCVLFDPDQADLNKNAIGDVCDDDLLYRQSHDSDQDGILDHQDNAPKIANVDQKDTDQDNIGDVADNCVAIKNPDQRDSNKNTIGDVCEDIDQDGIDGWRDNCPMMKNPDQSDANNDGIGNLCEDFDIDSIYDSLDNCPGRANLDQKDTDKDGIGNACDEKDDRLIESNRGIFVAIFSVIFLMFILGIVYFIRKLKL